MSTPSWQTAAQREVHELLSRCATEFARQCRDQPNPKFPRDVTRTALLRYGRGLGTDETAAFLRARDAGLVVVEGDGHFLVPQARACSPNLHLVGRNNDHVALHTEVLIHLGAYAELVLDRGWDPHRIVFDPFIRDAALDLWGYRSATEPGNPWWDGTITFAAEAKARVAGSDSLSTLAAAFACLELDPGAVVDRGHRRKWDELVAIVTDHGPIDLLLAADGARWWYLVDPARGTVTLNRRA